MIHVKLKNGAGIGINTKDAKITIVQNDAPVFVNGVLKPMKFEYDLSEISELSYKEESE